MSREGRSVNRDEPPEWALPSWDAVPSVPGPPAVPASAAPVPGTPSDAARRPRPPEPPASAAPAVPGAPAGPPSGFDLVDPLRRTDRQAEPSGRPLEGSPLRILQVSDVTRAIRDAVRANPGLRDVWIEGEVGRVTVSSAGHAYFTLKDDRSQLACVFFRDDRVASPFEPRTGFRVVVRGRVDVFETQGVYQLYVASVQPAGFGDLALRFEALKAKLAAEGLFDAARKRPLPVRPPVIGVATSATGAVWHDICNVLRRRWPMSRVVLSACRVQGEGAAASVVNALGRLDHYGRQCRRDGRPEDAPAVVILARGGGSLEDLWPFNDERVVRAVVAHPVPVVCGVGHEVDVTLADFAADVRAPTPSAAAELVVPDRLELAAGLADLDRRARRLVAASFASARRDVAVERRALDGLRPAAQLAQARERAGYLLDRATGLVGGELARRRRSEAAASAHLDPAVRARLAAARAALDRSHAALQALGPQATLDRGYAIVRRRETGEIVRDPDQVSGADALRIRLALGEIDARVEGDGSTPPDAKEAR